MLDEARELLRDQPVTFVCWPAATFGQALKGRRVDRVVSNAAFFQFRGRRRVLAEIRKVLKPDGLFGFTLPGPHDHRGRFDLAAEVTSLLCSRHQTAPRRAERPRARSELPCTYQTVHEVLAQAGFNVLSSEFFGYQPSQTEIKRWILLPVFRPFEWEDFAEHELQEALAHVLASRPVAETFSWNLIIAGLI
jgi:SAM-dependent methyltransferase